MNRFRILMWFVIACGLLAISMGVNAYWGTVTQWFSLPTTIIPNSYLGWYIGVAILLLIAVVIGWLTDRIPPPRIGTFDSKFFMRALSSVCAWIYIGHMIGVHDRLGTVVFNAYFFSVQNFAIGASIIGLLLVSWLFSDGTRKIPWRKILGLIILGIVIFVLIDYYFQGFHWRQLMETDWQEINWGNVWNAYWQVIIPVGLIILILLLIFSPASGRKFINTALLLTLTAVLIHWVWNSTTQPSRSSNEVVSVVRAVKGLMKIEVSSKGFTEIRFPSRRIPEGYMWRQTLHGEKGEGDPRPLTIIGKKGGVREIYDPEASAELPGIPALWDPLLVKVLPPPQIDEVTGTMTLITELVKVP